MGLSAEELYGEVLTYEQILANVRANCEELIGSIPELVEDEANFLEGISTYAKARVLDVLQETTDIFKPGEIPEINLNDFPESTRKMLERVEGAAEQDSELYNLIGAAFLWNEARKLYEKALKATTDDDDKINILNNLGDLYGKFPFAIPDLDSKSIKFYQEALQIDPENSITIFKLYNKLAEKDKHLLPELTQQVIERFLNENGADGLIRLHDTEMCLLPEDDEEKKIFEARWFYILEQTIKRNPRQVPLLRFYLNKLEAKETENSPDLEKLVLESVKDSGYKAWVEMDLFTLDRQANPETLRPFYGSTLEYVLRALEEESAKGEGVEGEGLYDFLTSLSKFYYISIEYTEETENDEEYGESIVKRLQEIKLDELKKIMSNDPCAKIYLDLVPRNNLIDFKKPPLFRLK